MQPPVTELRKTCGFPSWGENPQAGISTREGRDPPPPGVSRPVLRGLPSGYFSDAAGGVAAEGAGGATGSAAGAGAGAGAGPGGGGAGGSNSSS